jgi:hypothetical protein
VQGLPCRSPSWESQTSSACLALARRIVTGHKPHAAFINHRQSGGGIWVGVMMVAKHVLVAIGAATGEL